MPRSDYLLVALMCAVIVAWMLLTGGCTTGPAPMVTSAAADDDVSSPPAARPYRRSITREARAVWGLTPDLVPVFAAQISVESAYRPDAQSPYAAGLSQFTPATAAWAAREWPELGPADVFNPDWSIRAMVRYDKFLYERVRYDDRCNKTGAMLSSFNGGPGWHDKRQRMSPTPDDFWNSVRTINPGITSANQRENETYSQKIVFERQRNYSTWGSTVCV